MKKRLLEIEEAHTLANCIHEAESLGIFHRMDERTKNDLEYAHLTANMERTLEAAQ